MVYSADRRFLYITDNGIMRIEQAGKGGNTLSIVDVAKRQQSALSHWGIITGLTASISTGQPAVCWLQSRVPTGCCWWIHSSAAY